MITTMRSVLHLLTTLVLVAQAAGEQGDGDYDAQADNYDENGNGQYYNNGNDYNANAYDGYNAYGNDADGEGDAYYGENGYVANYNNGYNNGYDFDEDADGDGMGGAWINGVYRPFCVNEDSYQAYQGNGQDNGNYQQQEGDEDVECIEYNKYIPAENCEQGTITVKSVSISCDSAYTFYYGNGAHQNSQLCDYGDMATITVFFKNAYNLPSKKPIYMTMGVYARKSNLELVYAAENVDLCGDMVGHQCTAAGNYAFAFRAKFDYIFGDRSQFVPVVEMGFSTDADLGYNLGGVNIDCQFDGSYRPYNPWLNRSTTWGAGAGFAANYGLFIGVLLLLGAFAMYAYKHYGSDIEWKGVDWSQGFSFGEKKPLEEGLVISPSGSVAET